MNFFDGWQPILRVLVVGPLAYGAMVFLLRISGKRTLSKMNAFDFVVTIAFGSVLASILTNDQLSLATGVTAIAVLVFGQLVITFLSVRVPWVESVVKARPTLLAHRGELLRDEMRRTRVSEAEVMAALRDAGYASITDIQAVVLETDGTVTVIPKDRAGGGALEALTAP